MRCWEGETDLRIFVVVGLQLVEDEQAALVGARMEELGGFLRQAGDCGLRPAVFRGARLRRLLAAIAIAVHPGCWTSREPSMDRKLWPRSCPKHAPAARLLSSLFASPPFLPRALGLVSPSPRPAQASSTNVLIRPPKTTAHRPRLPHLASG